MAKADVDDFKTISKLTQRELNLLLEKYPLSDKCVEEVRQLSTLAMETAKTEGRVHGKKRGMKAEALSAGDIFHLYIAPQIKARVTVFRQTHKDVDVSVNFSFKDIFTLSLDELIKEHSRVLQVEETLNILSLVTAYQRGMIYMAAHQKMYVKEDYEKWLKMNFGICYHTALGYMTVTGLLKSYPTLFVADLSFSQLRKHHRRIREFMKTEEALHGPVTFLTGDTIEPGDITVCSKKFSGDPDHRYADLETPSDEFEAVAKLAKERKLKNTFSGESDDGLSLAELDISDLPPLNNNLN